MSISLSLRVGPTLEPGAAGLVTLAWADAFVPDTWWSLVEASEAMQSAHGLVFVVPSAVALRRLRAAAPLWRAVGGRHVLRLRAIEAGFARFPDWFVHVELDELYETRVPDAADLARPTPRRASKNPGHGGTLADELVGAGTDTERSALAAVVQDLAGEGDLSILERHIESAAMANDPAELDLLEEALALHCAAYHAWAPIVRRRWMKPSSRSGAHPDLSAVVLALASGESDPFAPARALPVEVAAPALFAVGTRLRDISRGFDRAQRKALRAAITACTDPLAAPLALGAGAFSDSLEGLFLAEWLDDGTAPAGSSKISQLACRLAAVGTEEPLSTADQPAWVERVLRGDVVGFSDPDDTTPWHIEYAIRRGLTLERGVVERWHRERPREVPWSDETVAAALSPTEFDALGRTFCADAIAGISRLDPAARRRLLAVEAPEDAFLQGAARSCVLLALGRSAELQALLAAFDSPLPVAGALRAGGMAALPMDLLERRAAAGDFDAAALLLESAGASLAARQASRALLPDALLQAQRCISAHDEGELSTLERSVTMRRLEPFAHALGADGEALRSLLVPDPRWRRPGVAV